MTNNQLDEIEDICLELLLAHKLTVQTLFRSNTKMTMSTHVVISAQDKRATEARERFEQYLKTYNFTSSKTRKKFEEIEKL